MQKIDEEKEKITGREDKEKKKKRKKKKHRHKNKNNEESKDKSEMKDNKKSNLSNDQFIINGNYNLIKMLGFGAFGEIHLAYDTNTKLLRAIKFETANHKNPQLKHEHSILEQLNKSDNTNQINSEGTPGIPRVYLFDRMESKYNYMVMDFLGPSISDLFQFKEKSFSLETVLMIGIQMITRIEFIHEKGFIHRDIKPENFVIGLNDKSNIVHIIDFGLSKRYKDKNTGQHIPYRENRHLVGTVRYASINAHLGIEQSRRDDIESIGYVLVYFFLGRLPWQSKMDKGKPPVNKIMEKKLITPPEILCKKLPSEFAYYFHYCKNLKFEDRPDYSTLKYLFADLLASRIQIENEFVFDWFEDNITNNKNKNEIENNNNNNDKKGNNKQIQSGIDEKDENSFDNKDKENVTPGNDDPISIFGQTKKGEEDDDILGFDRKPDTNFQEKFLKNIENQDNNDESKSDDDEKAVKASPKHSGEVIKLQSGFKKQNSKRSYSESESDDTERIQAKEKNKDNTDENKDDQKSSGCYEIIKSSNSSEDNNKQKNKDIILNPKNDNNDGDVALKVKLKK